MRNKLAVAVVLALLLPLIGSAEDAQKIASFAILYDLDSATAVYPRMVGQGLDPWGAPIPGNGMIKTVGASTTVTESTASQLPFADLAVGDVLFINYEGNRYIRTISAKASGASITVDTTITLTNNATFSWMKLQVGSAATDGWIPVTGLGSRATLTVQYNAGDLTGGLDVFWECRTAGPDNQPIQVYPATGVTNFATAGAAIGTGLVIYEEWSACRIGMYAHTADPGDPTVEKVTAHIVGR